MPCSFFPVLETGDYWIEARVMTSGKKESYERELVPGPQWASLQTDLLDNLRYSRRLRWWESHWPLRENTVSEAQPVVSARQWSEGTTLDCFPPAPATTHYACESWKERCHQEPPEEQQELSWWWPRWKRTPKVSGSEEASRSEAFRLGVAQRNGQQRSKKQNPQTLQ